VLGAGPTRRMLRAGGPELGTAGRAEPIGKMRTALPQHDI
jgi:hypothetical protein